MRFLDFLTSLRTNGYLLIGYGSHSDGVGSYIHIPLEEDTEMSGSSEAKPATVLEQIVEVEITNPMDKIALRGADVISVEVHTSGGQFALRAGAYRQTKSGRVAVILDQEDVSRMLRIINDLKKGMIPEGALLVNRNRDAVSPLAVSPNWTRR